MGARVDPEVSAFREAGRDERLSESEQRKRKERILTRGTPSIARGISDAVILKDRNLFFLTEPTGQIPFDQHHGLGLYYNDCRYLSAYTFRIAGIEPQILGSTAGDRFAGVFQLTNPEIDFENGQGIERENLGIRWDRILDHEHTALHDRLTFHNYSLSPIDIPISFCFRASFEDVFAVRGLLPLQPGRCMPPEWRERSLVYEYEGGDGRWRALVIRFSFPFEADGEKVELRLRMQPKESTEVRMSMFVGESERREEAVRVEQEMPDIDRLNAIACEARDRWLADYASFESNSVMLDRIVSRALRDLRSLESTVHGRTYISAGIPWFATLFGRDSAIASLQTLAFNPNTARQTLRLLASYQGEHENGWRDEQPGKILHELRVGELALMGEIPYTPYYGTIDATPLFLILLARYSTWCGDFDLFDELEDNVRRAIEWIDRWGDADGDGFLEYESQSGQGLINQGWKDSGDAIVNEHGDIAKPPIALVEVQGYVCRAKREIAALYARRGDREKASRLESEADALQRAIGERYWLEDLRFFAMALNGDKEPLRVVSSNPGHLLWARATDGRRAEAIVETLMGETMFSGWGIRTLSSDERAWNPIGYHVGTVWPHDNSMILAGFREYGFDREACRIADAIISAATHFEDFTLPEVFTGVSRETYQVPVRYPVACHPQAWSAASLLYMMETLLGIVPDGFERRLRIVRPTLPDFADRVDIRGIRIAGGVVDLHFERRGDRSIEARATKVEGDVDVVVE